MAEEKTQDNNPTTGESSPAGNLEIVNPAGGNPTPEKKIIQESWAGKANIPGHTVISLLPVGTPDENPFNPPQAASPQETTPQQPQDPQVTETGGEKDQR